MFGADGSLPPEMTPIEILQALRDELFCRLAYEKYVLHPKQKGGFFVLKWRNKYVPPVVYNLIIEKGKRLTDS